MALLDEFLYQLPLTFYSFAILSLLCIGLYCQTHKFFQFSYASLVRRRFSLSANYPIVGCLGLGLFMVALFCLTLWCSPELSIWNRFSCFHMRYARFSELLTVFLGFGVLILSVSSMRHRCSALSVELFCLKATVLGTSVALFSVNDLLLTFFLLELYGMCGYGLVAKAGSPSTLLTEAALRYFFLGSTFSVITAYGLALIYLGSGLTTLSDLVIYNSYFMESDVWVLNFGFGLFLAGLLFKLSVAPFHVWAPDTYEAADTNTSAFLLIVPKVALTMLVWRFYDSLGVGFAASAVGDLLYYCAILSILVGSLGALFQLRMKKLFVYTGISSTGYILLLLLSSTSSTENELTLVFFITLYLITLLGIFSVFFLSRRSGQTRLLLDLPSLVGYGRTGWGRAFVFAVFLFANLGLPPFSGFIAKFWLLVGLQRAGFLLGLVVVLLMSVLTAFYFLRLVRFLLFVRRSNWIFLALPSRTGALIAAFLFLLLPLLFIYNGSTFFLIFGFSF